MTDIRGVIVPIPLDVESVETIPARMAIRELVETKKQYRNYRNTIRQMLDSGELVYVGKNKETPW